MKIVHVASELFPYIKTGGLADAVGALSSTLADHGHEVAVFVPGYRAVVDHPGAAAATRTQGLRIEMGDTFMTGEVRSFSPKPNLTIHLICREEFFDRRNPYGTPERDYEDNHHRFIFFCKGVVETMRFLDLRADVVHGHDWQCGLLPLLLRHAEQRYNTTLAILPNDAAVTNAPDNSHVMPMLALHLAGLALSVMGAAGLYYTVFEGMRVRDRSSGGHWSLPDTLLLEVGLLAAGVLAAWWGQRRPRP